MATLTIYLDDSGTHTTSKVATVGAWIARVPMWERFTKEWNRALKKYCIKRFHMAELMANNSHSEFADHKKWDEGRKRAVLARLIQITRMRTMQGLGFSVNQREYNETVPKPIKRVFGEYHYTFVVRSVIGLFEQYRSSLGITEPTEYVFDRMTKGDAKREIIKVFEESEDPNDTLHRWGIYKGCYSFRDKQDITPLQAADLTAWLINQRTQMDTVGKPVGQIAAECWNALTKDNHLYSGVARGHHLTDWIETEKATPGTGIYDIFENIHRGTHDKF